jgi:pantoate--beta-alanine ligase
MKMLRTPREVRDALRPVRRAGSRIGFVPTMGALHEGHAHLVSLARERTDYVVASLFVNPKQFGPREDFQSYPRNDRADAKWLRARGCDLLFVPTDSDVYSSQDRTRVHVTQLSQPLCGAFRPGHFDGVALIVAKLFNIVQPDEAFFGQKDAQQAVIIQRMAADLDFPVRITLGATVREPDGLAMSSRNRYLDVDSRERAVAIHGALEKARTEIEGGARNVAALEGLMRAEMEGAGFEVDYAEIVDGETLQHLKRIDGLVLVAAAGRIGGARLIDNIALRVMRERVEEILLEFPEWSRYGG